MRIIAYIHYGGKYALKNAQVYAFCMVYPSLYWLKQEGWSTKCVIPARMAQVDQE